MSSWTQGLGLYKQLGTEIIRLSALEWFNIFRGLKCLFYPLVTCTYLYVNISICQCFSCFLSQEIFKFII